MGKKFESRSRPGLYLIIFILFISTYTIETKLSIIENDLKKIERRTEAVALKIKEKLEGPGKLTGREVEILQEIMSPEELKPVQLKGY